MSKITSLRIKYANGNYSDEIPISVVVDNVNWDSVSSLADILGQLDIEDGTVKTQLDRIVYESKAAAQNGTTLSLVTTGQKYNWNSKTDNTGTVTGVTAGTGLSGGTVSTSGTIKANLNSETSLGTIGTTDKLYAVGIDSNGRLSVSVPWTDTTYIAATADPLMDGTKAVGTSTKYAREDHVHPSDTSKVSTSRTINSKALSNDITLSASDVGAIDSSLKGANNGVAELDASGKVPSSQLPSYVDDVLEYNSLSDFPDTGETGKIYVSKATNLTYRWSGTAYVEISPSLALGTTSSTAFRGDYGDTAYSHATDSNRLTTAQSSGLYKISTTAEGHVAGVTAVEKSDITGLGIPGSDTTYESKTAAQSGTDVSLVTTGEKYNWNNKVDSVSGKGLSENDFTTILKNKLDGIASGAEVNQNAFSNVKVNSTTIEADAKTDTIEFVAGTNVTITPDATNDKITIAATDTTYESKVAASGGTDLSLVTTGEKYNWNNAGANVQSDWNEEDSASDAFIKNKPTIPEGSEASSSTPLMDGTAAVGTSTKFARGDHVHPSDTSKADKTATVSTIVYDGTNKKITKTINGTTTDVVTVATLKTDLGSMPASDVSSWAKADSKPSYALSEITGADDVQAIEALSGTSGLLKKTAANTWALDTTSYVSDISGKADKSATVSTVTYDGTNKKITKTINGTTTDVVTVATLKTDLGSMPASDVSAWAKADSKPSYTASEVGAIATSVKGTANGVAELDATGKVPSSQLPSYVDDVVEYAAKASFPATGETGKIYIDTSTDITYRWGGSDYVVIGSSLALGETSSTAYRGDRGKTAYDHATDSSRLTTAQSSGLYKFATTSEGHIASVSAIQKSDITGLGIPESDTTYESKTAANGGTDVSLVTTGQKYIWNNKTSNTGTVTSVGTGVGLTGGSITTSGTIKANLKSETASTLSSASMGSTADRQYAVGVDKDGYLSVNVPWAGSSYSNLPAAQGGTAESLVTTGDKYTWNQSLIADDAGSAASTSPINADQLNGYAASYYLTQGDIIDGFNSTSTTDALSANRGKLLYDEISTISSSVSSLNSSVSSLSSSIATKAPLANPTFTGTVTALSLNASVPAGTDYTTAKVRNIILSTSEPTSSDGNNGDVWIVYEE